MFIASIIFITAALVAYTLGIWAEKFAGRLKPWHAATFTLGLILDATGTFFMSQIAQAGGMRSDGAAGALMSVMAITGALALILMALHAGWAIVALIRNRDNELAVFHRFSLVVWGIWLVPYFTGMAASML